MLIFKKWSHRACRFVIKCIVIRPHRRAHEGSEAGKAEGREGRCGVFVDGRPSSELRHCLKIRHVHTWVAWLWAFKVASFLRTLTKRSTQISIVFSRIVCWYPFFIWTILQHAVMFRCIVWPRAIERAKKPGRYSDRASLDGVGDSAGLMAHLENYDVMRTRFNFVH